MYLKQGQRKTDEAIEEFGEQPSEGAVEGQVLPAMHTWGDAPSQLAALRRPLMPVDPHLQSSHKGHYLGVVERKVCAQLYNTFTFPKSYASITVVIITQPGLA